MSDKIRVRVKANTHRNQPVVVEVEISDFNDPRLTELVQGSKVKIEIEIEEPTEAQASLLGRLMFLSSPDAVADIGKSVPPSTRKTEDFPVEVMILNLRKPVSVLEPSVRAANRIEDHFDGMRIDEIPYWRDCELGEDEILKLKNFGRSSFKQTKEALDELGLRLGMRDFIEEHKIEILRQETDPD